MACPGTPHIPPTHLESEAAQLRVVEWFRSYFTSRYPGGIVISELEYMARTTRAPNQPGPLRLPGQPDLSAVLDALTSDFRRWSKARDFRKCDALGIELAQHRHAELLEVTTVGNVASATRQIAEKLAILRGTVEKIHNLRITWMPSPWRPAPNQMIYPLPAKGDEIARFICYWATYKRPAPPGVILYEVHAVQRKRVPDPVPVPKKETDKIREGFRNGADQEAKARRFAEQHPAVVFALRAAAAIVGVAALVAAIVAIIDPVPGDEVAAASFAIALLTFAISGPETQGSGGTL